MSLAFRNETVSLDDTVDCAIHGSQCLAIFVSSELPLQCASCVKFLHLRLQSRAPIRVTRRMIVDSGPYACDACGGSVDPRITREAYISGLNISWTLRDDNLGLSSFTNLMPLHWRCFCIMGPNRVNSRANCIAIWNRVSMKTETTIRQTCVSRQRHAHVTKQLKELRSRHVLRFCEHETAITESDLINSWYQSGGCCTICGETIRMEPENARFKLSWDRENSALGYTAENTKPAHWACNSAKTNCDIQTCLEVYRATVCNTSTRNLPDNSPDDDDLAADEALERIFAAPPPRKRAFDLELNLDETPEQTLEKVVKRVRLITKKKKPKPNKVYWVRGRVIIDV